MRDKKFKKKNKFLIQMLVISTAFLTALTVIQPLGAQVSITIDDLGTLGGKAKSYANDINDDGKIVGTSNIGDIDGIPTLKHHAFIWHPEGDRMIDLETLGGSNSVAMSINELEQVVGYSDTSLNEEHAFLWTQKDGLQDLGTLGGEDSIAWDINNLGQVVGRSITVVGGSYTDTHAFLWTPTDDMIDLGTLGGSRSSANGINDFGQIAGDAENHDGEVHTYILTPEDTDGDGVPDLWYRDLDEDGANDLMKDLGTLGGFQSCGSKINDLGDVVGYSYDASNKLRACLWPESGGIVDLCAGQAHDINNLGQIVGYTYDAFDKQRAYLWTEEDNVLHLTLLPGSTTSVAIGINNIGRIVGTMGPIGDDLCHPVQWRTTEPADSAHERVEKIRQRILRLMEEGLIGQGQGRAMLQKLDTIDRQIEEEQSSGSSTLEDTTLASSDQVNKGNNQAAIKILESLKHQVNAYMNSGSLSQEDGEALIIDINAIIASLGG